MAKSGESFTYNPNSEDWYSNEMILLEEDITTLIQLHNSIVSGNLDNYKYKKLTIKTTQTNFILLQSGFVTETISIGGGTYYRLFCDDLNRESIKPLELIIRSLEEMLIQKKREFEKRIQNRPAKEAEELLIGSETFAINKKLMVPLDDLERFIAELDYKFGLPSKYWDEKRIVKHNKARVEYTEAFFIEKEAKEMDLLGNDNLERYRSAVVYLCNLIIKNHYEDEYFIEKDEQGNYIGEFSDGLMSAMELIASELHKPELLSSPIILTRSIIIDYATILLDLVKERCGAGSSDS